MCYYDRFCIKKLMKLLGLILVIVFALPQTCLAIPAWARKYDTSCKTCHRPNVPRLNVFGHNFRKRGFRLTEEIGKKPDYKEIGDYLSVRGRVRYNYENPDGGNNTTSEFEFHDATLFYAGSITENLSGFFEAEWEDSDDITLNAYIAWFMGQADQYLNIRLGQMHTLSRVGWAGFDRPSGISTTGVLSEKLTGTSVPFKMGEDQIGLELAVGVTEDIRIIAQVLNGLNFEGKGNEGSSDDDKDKDFLVAYEHILDSKGSGLTLFGYYGVWHQEPGTEVGGIDLPDSDDFNKFEFWRYGATASILFDIIDKGYSEILGGVIISQDKVPDNHPVDTDDTDGLAYFVGLEQYFDDASVFVRGDFIDPDTDENDWRNRYVLGTAYMVNDYLRLAGEGFWLDDEQPDADSIGFTLEAMLNF